MRAHKLAHWPRPETQRKARLMAPDNEPTVMAPLTASFESPTQAPCTVVKDVVDPLSLEETICVLFLP